MSQPVRAIYREGQLHLLDPVDIAEGEVIQVMILSDQDRVRAALGDLLFTIPERDEVIDEEALTRQIEDAFRGQPSLSETIIQERLEGW